MPTAVTKPATGKPDRLISALLEISNLVGSVMLLDDILDRIVRITADLMAVPICSIYMLQPDGDLLLRSNVGLEPALRGNVRLKPGEGIAGAAVQGGVLLALSDATTDARYQPLPSTLEARCRAYLCAPLRIQEEIIGVLTARRTEIHAFSQEECKFFETVCKQIAIVIEKARMYEQKIQAERLAGVAVSLSGVAHYIKNVLFTRQLGESMVQQGLKGNGDLDRVRKGWDVLQQANQKISKLVENMLNYCRQTKPRFEPVDLNGMIRDIVASIRGRAADRAGIDTRLDPRLGEVPLEPDSIYDVLLNLVTNALDAMPGGRRGRIVIRTERLTGQSNCRIEVIDNGAGIPEQNRDKVFNLFFSTKGHRGTGIGLAATRKVIEDHGGTIAFESTPGEGTRFTVHLPTARPAEGAVPVGAARAGA